MKKGGATVRRAVDKALKRAGSDTRRMFEEVLLRLDAGTDRNEAEFGGLSLKLSAADAVQEVHQGRAALRLKVVLEGTNTGKIDETITIVKATLYSPKGKMGLLVRGTKGERFSRTFEPNAPKFIAYGAVIPPRYGAGTPVVVTLEIEGTDQGGTRKIRKMRTRIMTVEKKSEPEK